MQFSESWLRSLCNPALTNEALCHLLTMAGLEVEENDPVAPAFSGVVVGAVLSVEKHPDADKLKLCRVDVGAGEPLQIVCGAPNVAAGMRVPCAQVGARLPGIEIRKAKVRGVESHGMLCSARELGLSEDHAGLLALDADAPPGRDLREWLDLDDRRITIKLTPNRADCLSLSGIARELAALTGADLQPVADVAVAPTVDAVRQIVLDAPDACPRYCGRVIRGVDSGVTTPEWMRRRIERSGIRPISFLVDVTNYVMLELGQPLHAFDNDVLDGAIHVRYPRPDETLLLLNGQTVTPSATTALIADEAKALAMAGIMGGEHSGISATTRDLFLESAFFPPAAIAGKARALGFSSDASHRYERGVDFTLQRRAIERATRLILDIAGGSPGPVVEAVSEAHLPQRKAVALRPARVSQVLGMAFAGPRIREMLAGLGMQVEASGDHLLATPPSFRFDIEIEEDLIEEVARLHGYDNIPSEPPTARLPMMPAVESRRGPMLLRRQMAARGFHEVVNFSFVDAVWEADFAGNAAPIRLANPIASQMGVMRSSLIGGLVGTLGFNRKRQADRVRVFEIGRCFRSGDPQAPVPGFDQPLRLAALASGSALPEQWGAPSRPVDFYDLKSDVEQLLAGRRPGFVPVQHPALHPGRAASVLVDGTVIGVLGEVHPRWVQKYELGPPPVVFELELAALTDVAVPAYAPVSRFPAVVRDLALALPQEQALQPLLAALKAAAPAIVRDIRLFDVYQGRGLTEGQKSLAFRIVMQDTERTLEDAEVESAIAALLAVAMHDFRASLRA